MRGQATERNKIGAAADNPAGSSREDPKAGLGLAQGFLSRERSELVGPPERWAQAWYLLLPLGAVSGVPRSRWARYSRRGEGVSEGSWSE